MKYTFLLLFNLLLSLTVMAQNIDQSVDSLLSLMTLDEKIGQMTQVERGALTNIQDLASYGIGSILSGGGSAPTPNTISSWINMYDNFQTVALQSRLGIPMIYGIDAVHGHNNVYGATIFPHNIGLGCTWNPELIRSASEVVAREVAATGIDWTFAPCIAVVRNERWGRTYEGFGETPEIQKIMARESVIGLQGTDLSHKESILACAKHFVGDGGTMDGKDQGNTVLTETELRAIHMPGYIDAIEAGVGTIMASYNSWNGQKLHGHDYLLTDVLKEEMGFEGFIISDWQGIDQITGNYKEAVKRGINAGIDMVMVPNNYKVFISDLKSLVQNNEVSEERIDDAVRRILKQKFLLNLFKKPFTDGTLAPSIGSAAHRAIARQTVRESLVLLNGKNHVLPLQKDGNNVLVAGALAKDLGAQCGGWTMTWQGANGNITKGTDILTGLQQLTGSSQIIYSPNGDHNGDIDVAVVVIGEKTPYAEGNGDRLDLRLDKSDIDLIKELKEAGIPVVAVLISGRPMIISEILPFTDAFIAAWYPGTEGDGIAEVLFGDYEPVGKLTHSWPKTMSQIPINFGDNDYDPLFAYKHGWQTFPGQTGNEQLLPYAASTNQEGNSILLALNDQITSLNVLAGDFELYINGTSIPNGIGAVKIADFDATSLELELNAGIQPGNELEISYSGNGIASADLILEPLNKYYVYNAVDISSAVHPLPGRIEAENYYDMIGVQLENCGDVGGGENVGYIEAGDWLKYKVEVKQTGNYKITGRIAGFAGGTLLLNFDNSLQAKLNYSSTNGWQSWKSFNTTIDLEAGFYTLQALAQSDQFNINYFEFDLISSSDPKVENTSQKFIKAYPNPVEGILHLEFTNTGNQAGSIRLLDTNGHLVRLLFEGTIPDGFNQYRLPLHPDLPKGSYFIELICGPERHLKTIVKN